MGALPTRLYLDSFTGEVLSRRSDLWGLYDFSYEIHIMKFRASRTYNHPVIVITVAATLEISYQRPWALTMIEGRAGARSPAGMLKRRLRCPIDGKPEANAHKNILRPYRRGTGSRSCGEHGVRAECIRRSERR